MFFDLQETNLTIDKDADLKNIQIKASAKSNINIFPQHLHELKLELSKTKVTLHYATVDKLSGSMSDNSALTVREVYNFDFQKDKSSKLRHWQ